MKPFANLSDGGRQLADRLRTEKSLKRADVITLVPIMPNGVPVALGIIDGLRSRTSLSIRIEPLEVIRSRDGVSITNIAGITAVFSLGNDPVIVVDDGVETGTAAMAAGCALRRELQSHHDGQRPALLLGVPVCPHQAMPDLLGIFDAVVAVHRPLARRSLSWHYVDFDVIDDSRAHELLRALES